MSRTTTRNSSKAKIPVKYWLSFKANTGKFAYWNGEEVVEVDDLKVVLLDVRGSITGWSDSANAKVWSNYLTSTKTENVDVMVGNKKVLSGLYADIKKEVEDLGGHYTQNLFCVVDLGEGWEIGCVQLSKSALGSYSEFTSTMKYSELFANVLELSKGEQQKSGGVKYFALKLETSDLSEELANLADEKDLVLQAYFNPSQDSQESDSAY
jgi:hypothetical protein